MRIRWFLTWYLRSRRTTLLAVSCLARWTRLVRRPAAHSTTPRLSSVRRPRRSSTACCRQRRRRFQTTERRHQTLQDCDNINIVWHITIYDSVLCCDVNYTSDRYTSCRPTYLIYTVGRLYVYTVVQIINITLGVNGDGGAGIPRANGIIIYKLVYLIYLPWLISFSTQNYYTVSGKLFNEVIILTELNDSHQKWVCQLRVDNNYGTVLCRRDELSELISFIFVL